ncbi:divalent metal cation transporter [Thiomonas sp.]|uniref:NRAMP family divalent metal transporter n=1 Tax=Thiomonas sp. TaxID=2047785 RepID=UPI00261350C1|nr:divalent metal cation transporter [Thiomonas sp.]
MPASDVVLSAEDRDRALDRRRVLAARQTGRKGLLVWLLLGPGVLVMLGENDGPSMLSYAATGASYGIGFFLPFIVLTFAAAYFVQEMGMRLGAVTHRGYGELIFQRFGAFWGWLTVGDLVITNLITLITEIIAIRVGMAHFGISTPVAVGFAVGLVIVSALGSRYSRWERISMSLAVFNLLFVVVAVLAKPSPVAIGHALLTWSPLGVDSLPQFLLLVASNIGATVTPWMLFFQQSATVDKGLTPRDIGEGRLDTTVGTAIAAVAGCAALLAAVPLFAHHVDTAALPQGGAGYAQALQPYVGRWGAALFALGLIEAGAVAMLTISASTAYALGEAFAGAGHSFNRSLIEAPVFHLANIGVAALAGAIVLIPGLPLLNITLNANLLAVLLMPPALVFLLVMVNDRELMGRHVNGWRDNVLAIALTVLIAAAGSASVIVSFFHTFHF